MEPQVKEEAGLIKDLELEQKIIRTLTSSLLALNIFFSSWLPLIFHLQGGIWKSYSSLYYVAVLVTQRHPSSFPQRENLIGRVSARCPFLSQSATALGEELELGTGLWDCFQHFPVDGIGTWGGSWVGRVRIPQGALGSKGACGTDRNLRGRREPVLENMISAL